MAVSIILSAYSASRTLRTSDEIARDSVNVQLLLLVLLMTAHKETVTVGGMGENMDHICLGDFSLRVK